MPVGLIFFAFITFIGYVTNASFQFVQIAICITNAAGILFFISRAKKLRTHLASIRIDKRSEAFKDLVLLLVVTIGLFVISLFSGWHPRGDAAIHLQCIHNLIGTDRLVFPFYSLIGSPIIPDHTYDAYYVLLALFQKQSGIALDVIWHYLSPIFLLFVPLVYYYLFRMFTDDRKLAQVFLVFFFVCTVLLPDLMNATLVDALVYPNRIYFFVLLPIMLGLAIDYLKNRNRKSFILSILCLNTFFFIHQSGYLFTLLLLGGAFLLNFLCRNWRGLFRSYVVLLGTLVITSIPLLILKLSYNLNFIQKASDTVWKAHYRFTIYNENMYAFPIDRYGKWGMVLAPLIMLYIFFKERKKGKQHMPMNQLLTASIVIPLFIVFNPLVVPSLGKLISYPAIGRMLRLPMYYSIFGYGLYYLFTNTRLTKFSNVLSGQIKLLLKTGLILTIVLLQLSGRSVVHSVPTIAEVVERIPEGSLVYSDKLTCTDMAELKRIVVPLIQFNGATDLVPIDEEKKEALFFFSGDVNENYIRKIIQKYSVDYIVLKKSEQSKACERILQKIFTPTFENTAYSLYRTP